MTQSPTFNFTSSPWPGSSALPAINQMIRALLDDNAGPVPPPSPVAFMRWRDTSVSPPVLRFRNAANSGWVDALPDMGLVMTGAIMDFAMPTAPAGWLKANGAAVSRSAYAALDAAIYSGDALNATALWGYRCTNASSPSTSRSTTGSFIVLPDFRAEFRRGWDDGRGVDVGRPFGSAQAQDIQSHSHLFIHGNGGTPTAGTIGLIMSAANSGDAGPTRPTGGTETRPRNLSVLTCIKF